MWKAGRCLKRQSCSARVLKVLKEESALGNSGFAIRTTEVS